MKRKLALSLFALALSLGASAQTDDRENSGIPTVPITRVPCLEWEGTSVTHEQDAPSGIARVASTQSQAPLAASGSPKILVCLANFADVKFTVASDDEALKALFDTFFNGKNQGAGKNQSSVADYFKAMSNGVFTPEFVITDPVTVSSNRSTYGTSQGSNGRRNFRNEALTQLAPQVKDLMSEYDTNGDQMFDGVVIVFAGCAATSGNTECIHPACWPATTSVSGVYYATSLVVPELLGEDLTAQGGENYAVLNGIGVCVHEISHMLGLPDFYDLNYKGPGMDYWSLMDNGEYWKNGYDPTPYTAYERNFMGWISLTELTEPTSISGMKSIHQGGTAYTIYNDGNRNEYYILEARTDADPWSNSLCTSLGSGLMIYHVDYSSSAWSSNYVNTDVSRQRMTIVPANGHFEILDNFKNETDKYISELRGHLWPLKNAASILAYWGIAGNNALTDEERTEGDRVAPAAVLHTPNTDGQYLMHKPITDIEYDYSQNTVSFNFMGGTPSSIDAVPETGIAGDATVKVYSLSGKLMTTASVTSLGTLPAGVYVIRDVSTGKTEKRILGKLQ